MNITVRFFASLREVMDRDAVDVEMEVAGATVAGLRDRLKCLLTAPQWEALADSGVQVAVNQAIVQGDAPLAPGDDVAFLPPVTGG